MKPCIYKHRVLKNVMVWYSLLLFGILLIILVKSSDYFVEAVARIAKYFGVSEFTIGLTVVAIGTSLPELTSSLMASLSGETELAMGNILGSNIANVGLILSLSAVVVALKTNKKMFLRDSMVLLGVSILFYLFCLDSVISLFEGSVLLLIVPLYLAYLFEFRPQVRAGLYNLKSYLTSSYKLNRTGDLHKIRELFDKSLKQKTYDDFVGKVLDLRTYEKIGTEADKLRRAPVGDIIILLTSGLILFLSAGYIIPLAVDIATMLMIPQNIIGVTLLAVGTSLPELIVAVSSIKKGFGNLLVGNIIGSNIFNITLVAGVSAIAMPLNVEQLVLSLTLPIMLLMTVLLSIFIRTGWRIKRIEGAGLFVLYLAFLYKLVQTGL
jgi:cation:H+ antiporter